MTLFDLCELFVFILAFSLLTIVIGSYMKIVFTGQASIWTQPFLWLENLTYRLSNINPTAEMNASTYLKNLCLFNFLGFMAVFFLMIAQGILPLNTENFPGTSFHLAYHTSLSFMTNSNLQSYKGENTLSYLTQMLGLGVQNFLSAATGLAVLVAFIRGIKSHKVDTIGNFYVDLVRSIIYIFLPLSLIVAPFLLFEGVIQTFSPYLEVITLEGFKQVIPFGPVASQVAIKQIGTNGGGFFGANSAHPFENPTKFTDFLETLCILLVPSASIYFYGLMTGKKKHIIALFSVVVFLFAIGVLFSLIGEYLYSHTFNGLKIMEGKEMRFGLFNSIFWSKATTVTSNGSVNAMMESLSPIASGIALFNMMVDELIFGGVGVGLCSLIIFVLLTVFLCGLMVGRTPEYLGKKIEAREMQWITLAILTPASTILIGTAITAILPLTIKNLEPMGPHGFTTILYAFTSAAANNGSSFVGLDTNTPYYNIMLGSIMLITRFSIIVASLNLAALLAKKKLVPPSIGTFSTNSPFFALLLLSVILIVGALTFFPALALGPVAEQILLMQHRYF